MQTRHVCLKRSSWSRRLCILDVTVENDLDHDLLLFLPVYKLRNWIESIQTRMALGICSANLSIGVFNFLSEQVILIENNRVLGIGGRNANEKLKVSQTFIFSQMRNFRKFPRNFGFHKEFALPAGKHFDEFLVHKGKRRCTIKPINEFEQKIYPNESVEHLMDQNVRWGLCEMQFKIFYSFDFLPTSD